MLERNWTGASTVPSRRQYPHQWGWDAAYIAFGWSWIDQARAAQELESILRGQWADGRVPHIVFNAGVPEDAYFPGPAFWAQRRTAPDGPRGAVTSGLTQPPLHARAALEVALHARDGERADGFLRRVFPRLAAQHRYLAGRRDAGGGGPRGDRPPVGVRARRQPVLGRARCAAVALPAGGVAPYERRDREHVDPAERPSDAWYDRFVHLARAYRDGGYADDGRSAFLVEDPLFNAIWLWSTHALAEIAGLIGEDAGPVPRGGGGHPRGTDGPAVGRRARPLPRPRPARGPAASTGAPSGRSSRCSTRTCPRTVARALADQLASPHFRSPAGLGVASYDLQAEDVDTRRYWRGPVWANLNWLLARGLRTHGLAADADALDAATLRLVGGAGLREYFDPHTGEGRGAGDFSWTAAVLVDLVRSRAAG